MARYYIVYESNNFNNEFIYCISSLFVNDYSNDFYKSKSIVSIVIVVYFNEVDYINNLSYYIDYIFS